MKRAFLLGDSGFECSISQQARRKRGCRGCSCTPFQKPGGANISFCTPKNLEGALYPLFREVTSFPWKIETSPGTPIWQRRVFKRSLNLSRSKFVGFSAGQRDFPLVKGPSVASVRVAVLLSRRPSLRNRTICRSEGAFRLSEGPSVRGGPPSSRGALVGQKIFYWSEGPSVA